MRHLPVTIPAVALAVLVVAPSSADAKAGIRLLHAIPGAGPASLSLEQPGRSVSVRGAVYGKVTSRRNLKPGRLEWKLDVGRETVASGTLDVRRNARYTLVGVPRGLKVGAIVVRDARTAPRRRARLRTLHASPEFGSPDLLVDDKRAASELSFGHATPYETLQPGSHEVEAVRTGTEQALIARTVSTPRGSVSTAVVIGTQGKPTQLIMLSDGRRRGATAAVPNARRGTRRVAAGETLTSIAADVLGSGASSEAISREARRLWRSNQRVVGGDPNLIRPGQTLKLR